MCGGGRGVDANTGRVGVVVVANVVLVVGAVMWYEYGVWCGSVADRR